MSRTRVEVQNIPNSRRHVILQRAVVFYFRPTGCMLMTDSLSRAEFEARNGAKFLGFHGFLYTFSVHTWTEFALCEHRPPPHLECLFSACRVARMPPFQFLLLKIAFCAKRKTCSDLQHQCANTVVNYLPNHVMLA